MRLAPLGLLLLLLFLIPPVASVGNGPYTAQDVFYGGAANDPTYNATLHGSPAWVASGVNFSSLTSDYADIPHNTTLDFTSQMTILVWANVQDLGGALVSKGWSGYGDYANYQFCSDGNNLRLMYGETGVAGEYGTSDLQFSLGSLCLYGVSINFSDGVSVTEITWYKNDTSSSVTNWAWSDGIGIPSVNTKDFDINRYKDSGTYYYSNQTIYGVYLFDRTITDDEESYIYNHPDQMPSNATSLVFFQMWNEGSGDSVLGYVSTMGQTTTTYSHYWDQADGSTTYQYNFSYPTTNMNCTFPTGQNVTDVFDGAGDALPVSAYSTDAYNSTHSMLVLNATTIIAYGTSYKFATVALTATTSGNLYFGVYAVITGLGITFFILAWMLRDTYKAVTSMMIAFIMFAFLTVASFSFEVGWITYNNYYVGYIFTFLMLMCLISLLQTVVGLLTGKKTRRGEPR